MRTLLIDDKRDIEADVVARTWMEGINAIKYKGPFDILYLDHDLGEQYESMHVDGESFCTNGYGIMCFLEAHPRYLPKEIVLVTSNPVGRRNMQVVIDILYGKERS